MEKIDLGNISLGGAPTPAPQAQKPPVWPPEAQIENDIYYDCCEEAKVCNLGCTALEDQGRILTLSLTLKCVCPGKRVALGIALLEVDDCHKEYPRGLKTITIPAHHGSCCKDIPVSGMRFVMPEDLSLSGSKDICTSKRHFVVRVDAHYVDMTVGDCGCEHKDCGCGHKDCDCEHKDCGCGHKDCGCGHKDCGCDRNA